MGADDGRYSRELIVDALRRWHSAKCDQLIKAGIGASYLDSPRVDDRATVGDRSARIDLDSELVIGRATVWNRGFCDLELLAVHTGEQILYRHHESVSGIRLWALLDELADQMASP